MLSLFPVLWLYLLSILQYFCISPLLDSFLFTYHWINGVVLVCSGCYNKKHNKLGGLKTTEIYFWRVGSPRSKCWKIQCLVRAVQTTVFCCNLTWHKGLESSVGFLYKDTCSIQSPPKSHTSYYCNCEHLVPQSPDSASILRQRV